jgi:hypothetical protein
MISKLFWSPRECCQGACPSSKNTFWYSFVAMTTKIKIHGEAWGGKRRGYLAQLSEAIPKGRGQWIACPM